MADPNDEAVKQGQIASEKVFRRQVLVLKFQESLIVDPTLGISESAIGLLAYDSKIEKAILIPDGPVSALDAANATFILTAQPGATAILTFTPSAAFVALSPIDMGLAEYDALENDILTFTVTKSGPGVTLPSFLVVVTYRQK